MLYERFGGACKLPFRVCLEKEERFGSDDENDEVDIATDDVSVEELDASCFCFSVFITAPPGVVLSSKRGDEGGGDQLRASDIAMLAPEEPQCLDTSIIEDNGKERGQDGVSLYFMSMKQTQPLEERGRRMKKDRGEDANCPSIARPLDAGAKKEGKGTNPIGDETAE